MVGIRALLDGKLSREAARERKHDAVLEELARRPGDEPNEVAAD
jgi:hypothetical protein